MLSDARIFNPRFEGQGLSQASAQSVYDGLDENEKFALEVSILNVSPKVVGPARFPGMGNSTYYKYNADGRDKLVRRGILDARFRPTNTAFQVLPLPVSVELMKGLFRKMEEFRDNWVQAEERALSQTNTAHDLERQIHTLEKEVEQLKIRVNRFAQLERIAKDFTGLRVNEKLMAAIVALNLLESSVKRKLELLEVGFSPKMPFGELYELLRKNLLEKEGRKLKQHLLSPKVFYEMRSHIDHWAYKVEEIDEEECTLVVGQCLRFVNDIFGAS